MMFRWLLASLLLLGLGLGCQEGAPSASTDSHATSPPPPVESEQDKTLYLLGTVLGGQLVELQLDPKELAVMQRGLGDAALKRSPLVEDDNMMARLATFRAERVSRFTKAFLAEQAEAPGAQVFPSGLIMTQTEEGTGASPTPEQTVKVHYRGTLADGQVFDSSIERGTPAEFPLNGVIPCWTEGLGKMKAGGKSRLVCPAEIAYGERGRPPVIPPDSALVFEVELIEIVPEAATKP